MREISTVELGFDAEMPFRAYVMDNDDDWHAFRTKGIGGSDVAPIMGISKWRTPIEVWLERTGRDVPDDISDNPNVHWGVVLESVIADEFARRHPEFEVSEVKATLVSKARPWAHANLDRRIKDGDGNWGVLEIKTARYDKDWKDGVPDYYLTQVTHYLSVTGWKFAYVAVLIGGSDYREYRIERDEGDIRMVDSMVDDFWKNYVVQGVMPQLIGLQAEAGPLAKAIGPGSEIGAPDDYAGFDELVRRYEEAGRQIEALKESRAADGIRLRNLIGKHKALMSDVWKVTWVRGDKTRFDTRRFRKENPELAKAYEVTSVSDNGLRVSEVAR